MYETTLRDVSRMFPQYMDELEGIAQGAKVPFFKVSPHKQDTNGCLILYVI